MTTPSPPRSTSDFNRWAASAAVIGCVVGATMELLGMEPRLALVGLVVAVTAGVSWLFAGLTPVATPLSWYDYGAATDSRARPDRRVQLLTARLRHSGRSASRGTLHRGSSTRSPGSGRPEPADEIIGSLVAVVDAHLLAEYGVDRSDDIGTAHDVLGPELARFVSDASAARTMTRPRTLAHTIALIEVFTASTATPTRQP